MKKPVLLDTTAWIDFLRAGSRTLGDTAQKLIAADRAVLCGVVVAELLRGFKGAREQRQLHNLLDTIPRLDTIEQDWEDAGNMLRRLREKGITVPLTDAVVAVVAQRNGIAVLTSDDHFRHLGVDLLDPLDYR